MKPRFRSVVCLDSQHLHSSGFYFRFFRGTVLFLIRVPPYEGQGSHASRVRKPNYLLIGKITSIAVMIRSVVRRSLKFQIVGLSGLFAPEIVQVCLSA